VNNFKEYPILNSIGLSRFSGGNHRKKIMTEIKITSLNDILRNIYVPPKKEKILKALNALDNMEQEEYNRESKCVKLFNAIGGGTWELIAFDPETKMAFGLCDLGLGFPELGYVSVADLFKSVPMLEMDNYYDLTWRDVLAKINLE